MKLAEYSRVLDNWSPSRSRALIGAAAAFVLGILVLVAAGLPDAAAIMRDLDPNEGGGVPVIGGEAPAFTAVTVDGTRISGESLRGQPIVVNFWATWCGPCQIEMPELQALYSDRQDAGLRVLAVNVNEAPQVFVPWARSQGLTFDLVADGEGQLQTLFHVRGVPQTIVIGADGMIRDIFYGPIKFDRLQRVLVEE
ncbi:MAG: TlpA disulfide reductase family protein [Anaerolineae bacterium]